MIKLLRKVYAWYFYFLFGVMFLGLYPIFMILLSRKEWHPTANKLRRIWAWLLMAFMGMRWQVKYEESLQGGGPYIFCPNHASNLDIPLFALAYRGYFKFMAKMEWAEIPLFGIFFRTIDIPVKRESIHSAWEAYKAAEQALEQNTSIVIYPEGKMIAEGPKTLPFKNGAFKLAIERQVPVVPVTFLDNWFLYPDDGRIGARPGKARIIIHKPISTVGLNKRDVEELKRKVHSIINETLKEGDENR